VAFGNKYKLAKKADPKKTSFTADRARRGRPIDPPTMEPTPAEKREMARQARNEAAMARGRIKAEKVAKVEKKRARVALRKAKILAKKAAKAAANKDAKKYKK